MSYRDFCICTPEEFESVCKAFNEQQQSEYQNKWEITRILWSIEAQTHSTKKIDPLDAMPFSWDKKRNQTGHHPLTKKDKEHSKRVFHMGEHY